MAGHPLPDSGSGLVWFVLFCIVFQPVMTCLFVRRMHVWPGCRFCLYLMHCPLAWLMSNSKKATTKAGIDQERREARYMRPMPTLPGPKADSLLTRQNKGIRNFFLGSETDDS